MKILLDENLPTKIKYDFGKGFEVSTVKDLGWTGKKNGELLALMTAAGHEVLLTVDQGIAHPQNLQAAGVAVGVEVAVAAGVEVGVSAVSYTHLRAHATPEHIV